MRCTLIWEAEKKMESHLEVKLCLSEGRATGMGKKKESTEAAEENTVDYQKAEWEAEGHPIWGSHGAKGHGMTEANSCLTSFRFTIAANISIKGISALTTAWEIVEFLWICSFQRMWFFAHQSLNLRKIVSHSHTNRVYTSFGAEHYSCTLSKSHTLIPMSHFQLFFSRH